MQKYFMFAMEIYKKKQNKTKSGIFPISCWRAKKD